jgi:hypothetical protein
VGDRLFVPSGGMQFDNTLLPFQVGTGSNGKQDRQGKSQEASGGDCFALSKTKVRGLNMDRFIYSDYKKSNGQEMSALRREQ